MTDVLTKKQRSYNMSKIRGSNTDPEKRLRAALRQCGFRYRLKTTLTGKPDIIFPKEKVAVFIDGCFWHHCPKHFVKPQTRDKFWSEKIRGNVVRDKVVNLQLKKAGWKVLRFWEHEVKKNADACSKKIR